MRIVLVTGIFPPDIGGPATYVPRMAAALAERSARITVVTLNDGTDHDDSVYPFSVVRIPRRIFKPWRWFITILRLIRLGRSADVLFVNGLAMEAVIANLLLRKPMVQKVVGDMAWERATTYGYGDDTFEEFQSKRYPVKFEIFRTLMKWWIQKSDYVIAPSRYLARWIARWGVPDEKIAVIYNAVDPADQVSPARVGLPARVKLVTVGRLVPLKQVDQLIELIARREGVGLVVIGDGQERGRLERLAGTLGVGHLVHFLGQRSQKETLALMAACDVLVLNSTHESFPHVALEAMSLGLPVIATAVGGVPEVVRDGENGRLIAPSDREALYEAISEFLSRPAEQRQSLMFGAMQTARSFSFGVMVEETEAILKHAAYTRRKRERRTRELSGFSR